MPVPEGTFFLIPRSPVPDDAAFAARLAAEDVWVMPGSVRGAAGAAADQPDRDRRHGRAGAAGLRADYPGGAGLSCEGGASWPLPAHPDGEDAQDRGLGSGMRWSASSGRLEDNAGSRPATTAAGASGSLDFHGLKSR